MWGGAGQRHTAHGGIGGRASADSPEVRLPWAPRGVKKSWARAGQGGDKRGAEVPPPPPSPPPHPQGLSESECGVCLERVLSHNQGWQCVDSGRPWGPASSGSTRAGIGAFGDGSVRDEPSTHSLGC